MNAALKPLLEQALMQFKKGWFGRRKTLPKGLVVQLHDCVLDLRPCFSARGPASFLHVLFNSGLNQTEEWRGVNDRLSMAKAWFESWDQMQASVDEQITPEFFVQSIAGLNDLLYWTSSAGERLSTLLEQTPKSDPILKFMHALADGYNLFLSKYEAYLRRLPEEMGVRGMGPAPGMDKLFIRLRIPA
ncbi:MAG: hypothetical protein ABL977_02730 [Candidatus Eisenbacteria bacterium]